jgi:hypothetical protein
MLNLLTTLLNTPTQLAMALVWLGYVLYPPVSARRTDLLAVGVALVFNHWFFNVLALVWLFKTHRALWPRLGLGLGTLCVLGWAALTQIAPVANMADHAIAMLPTPDPRGLGLTALWLASALLLCSAHRHPSVLLLGWKLLMDFQALGQFQTWVVPVAYAAATLSVAWGLWRTQAWALAAGFLWLNVALQGGSWQTNAALWLLLVCLPRLWWLPATALLLTLPGVPWTWLQIWQANQPLLWAGMVLMWVLWCFQLGRQPHPANRHSRLLGWGMLLLLPLVKPYLYTQLGWEDADVLRLNNVVIGWLCALAYGAGLWVNHQQNRSTASTAPDEEPRTWRWRDWPLPQFTGLKAFLLLAGVWALLAVWLVMQAQGWAELLAGLSNIRPYWTGKALSWLATLAALWLLWRNREAEAPVFWLLTAVLVLPFWHFELSRMGFLTLLLLPAALLPTRWQAYGWLLLGLMSWSLWGLIGSLLLITLRHGSGWGIKVLATLLILAGIYGRVPWLAGVLVLVWLWQESQNRQPLSTWSGLGVYVLLWLWPNSSLQALIYTAPGLVN